MKTPRLSSTLLALAVVAALAGASSALAAITDGLIGYWTFDQTTGTSARDSAGTNNGALHNYPGNNSQWVPGMVGAALTFDGSSEFVYVPDYPKPTTNMTVAAWVWADAAPNFATILKNWGGASDIGQFHFALYQTAGDLSIYVQEASGSYVYAREAVPLPLGSWQHAAFVCDGTLVRLYHNGIQVASVPYDGTLQSAPLMSCLGIGAKMDSACDGLAATNSPGYWRGKIDDLGLWNRALNAAEISAIVAAGLQGQSLTNAALQPVITGGGVRISEFMASNKNTLTDDFGDSSDWIEIHNDSPATVNLDGWFLTDNASDLAKWRFPSTNMPPGTFLIVFASGRDRAVSGAPLHTNFKLDAGGEYLALVRPDGTIATEFSPTFPPQVTDVSYGFAITTTSMTLLTTGAVGRVLVPAGASLGSSWATNGFNDAGWLAATNGIGYETGGSETGAGLANDVLADAPLGYWRLGETSGNWVTNIGSLAPVGNRQLSGGVTLAVAGPRPPGFLGFESNNVAAHFDGVSGHIDADYTPDLNPSGPFTVECWVRPAWTSSAASPLSSQDYSGSGRAGYIFYQNGQSGADQWEFRLGDGSGYVAIAAGGAVQTDVWQHLAGVYSGTNAVLYVNGVPTASAALSRAFAPNRAQKFRLGANGDGIGQYFYLLNGDVDEVAVFNRALTAAEVSQRYQVAVSNPPLIASGTNFNYTSLIKTDLRPVMYGSNSTAYFRLPFVLTNAAAVKQLTLQLKYDDGFVAYLNGAQIAADNAPQPANWNSGALARRATSNALQFAQFDASGWTNLLQNGTNVLALQGLNYSASNADFLVLAELDATAVGYDSVPHYLDLPTPGSANVASSGELGPLITFAGHTPAVPGTNDSLSVSCRVAKTLSNVASVALNWRVMYGVTNQTLMFDDGLHGDGAAGDGIYGAFIDRTNYSAGQMVRWFITAADSLSRTSRWPLFPNPSDSAEYLGTVVQPDAVTTSALPVLHWFVGNSSAAGTAAGTHCSLFYNGQFYDNVAVRIRGGSTARNWPKKSYKFNMNSGEKFFVRTELPWVSAFDLNSTYSDKAYVRSVLTAEHQRDAGLPVMEEFHMQVRQNNQFFSVAIYVEQPNDDFLSRHGFDPDGALYKALGSPLGTYEKKTRLYEDNSDLRALLNGLNLAGTNLENFIFDNLDLADAVNFMATVAICQNIDASDKNHFLYRDSNGTREWRIFPWDLDLTFGPDRNLTDTIVFNLCDTNTPHCPSHPFIGARPYLLQSAKYHPLLEAIVNTPRARLMLLRRLRTLTDQFLAANYFQNRIEQLFPLLNPDVQLDQARWGANGNYPGQTYTLRQALDRVENEYLAPRVAFLAGTNIIGIGSNMPPSQPANAVISITDFDSNPASGNQDEEYVCLTNANPFAVDISGWNLSGGVQHTFEAGTVLPARGALYVSPNAAAFRSRALPPHGGMGLFVQGNYQGHLNAWGESLALTDSTGRLVTSNSFVGNPSPAQRYLRITEIMYNPAPLPGNTNDAQQFEYLELKNISTNVTLDLTGVQFTDGVTFSFTGSAVTNLVPGQFVLLVRNIAAFTARYGSGFSIAGQYAGALNNGGENLRMQDAVSEKILEFAYSNTWYPLTDGLGFSLVITDETAPWDTWGLKTSWRASGQLNGSPGVTDPPLAIAPVFINEALTHSDPATDWVELYDPTATNVNLSGWFLSDDFYTPKKYRIPSGTVVPAGGYLVLSGTNSFELGTNGFRLSEYGGQVYLFSGDAATNLTGWVHGFDFGAAPNGVSFGRYVTSQGREDFVLQSANTPGGSNALPRVGPIVIAEIMYHPPDLTNGVNDEVDEFIELHNLSATNVPLYCTSTNEPGYGVSALTNTWHLRNGVDYDFPTNQLLPAAGRLLVVGFDPLANPAQLVAFRALYNVPTNVPVYGPWSGHLDNAGETLELKRPDKPDVSVTNVTVPYVMIDEVAYELGAPWPTNADGLGSSLQRLALNAYGNDPANWTGAAPTAGQINAHSPPLAITALAPESSAVQVSVATLPGLTYTLEYKRSLTDANWIAIAPPVIGTGGNVTLTDTNAPAAQGFYRIRSQ
jgi:hypothetical protein